MYSFITQDKQPPWLLLDPGPGSIMPGSSSIVQFVIDCDVGSASQLNRGENVLDDVLILHLENGKDYFISITGTFVPTCLCRSLEDLIRTTEPVRCECARRWAVYRSHLELCIGSCWLISGPWFGALPLASGKYRQRLRQQATPACTCRKSCGSWLTISSSAASSRCAAQAEQLGRSKPLLLSPDPLHFVRALCFLSERPLAGQVQPERDVRCHSLSRPGRGHSCRCVLLLLSPVAISPRALQLTPPLGTQALPSMLSPARCCASSTVCPSPSFPSPCTAAVSSAASLGCCVIR